MKLYMTENHVRKSPEEHSNTWKGSPALCLRTVLGRSAQHWIPLGFFLSEVIPLSVLPRSEGGQIEGREDET